MLWYIEDTPHRILGSIHLLPPNKPFPSWVEVAYEGVGQIVFEHDVRNAQTTHHIGVDKSGAHLSIPGVKEMYRRAKQVLRSNGVGVDLSSHFRPWRACQLISVELIKRLSGVSSDKGIEVQLIDRATRDGTPITFLESPSRAYELLDAANRPGQGPGRDAMSRVVFNPTLEIQKFVRTLSAWQNSDLSELTAYLRQETALDSVSLPMVIGQRNREWLPVALEIIRSEVPTLFVVGALHTVGPGSFVEVIEERHYKCRFHTESKPPSPH